METWQVYGLGGELLAEYAANASPASPQKEYGYRNGQLLITAEPSTATRTNVAATSNGGTATAQNYTADSTYPGSHFQPSYATDGVRYTTTNGDHYWRDEHGLSSWLQVDFNGSKSIDEIDVYTMADNYTTQADPSSTQTFASYGVTSFTTQYWDGSAWQTVSGGSVTGNNLVWKKLTFTAVTTNKIRVVANAAVDSVARIVEVEAWGTAAVAPVNVASTTNGATATAQNYTADSVYPGSHFQPSYATDGVRYSTTIGDHYWRDEHGLSSWLQIDFSGSKTINEIDVYTMADNYATQADPSSTQTFANYGVTSFIAQYWTGSAWATVSGGSVTGNNLVWKKLSFAIITTTKIRVVANAAVDSVARIVEVEAWTPVSAAPTANINWLVTDQLGTPRMVFDQSGSLATVKRHDYAPFGEELANGARPTTGGYSAADGVRQKFTQKERDVETGLDYFLARYYTNTQGRFTSADSFGGFVANPQTLNRYAYVQNNPLKFIDPTGHAMYDPTRKFNPWDRFFGPADDQKLFAQNGQGPAPRASRAEIDKQRQAWINSAEGDAVEVTNIKMPGVPTENPSEDVVERYVRDPMRSALMVAAWASQGARNFGYAIAPDYGSIGFNLPLMAGGQLTFSKDRHLYGSYNIFGITGGNYNNRKNWKLGAQASLAYFATTEMPPQQRDAAIQGPAINITTGPVGGYFPLQGGPPAFVVGAPFTSLGVNVSGTHKIF